MVWFTSDTHFSHKNIIDYCNRPYETIKEMNEALVENWNDCIAPDDTVFHLGDVCMGGKNTVDNWIPKLNGEVTVIRGNHDYKKRETDMVNHGWDVVEGYYIFYWHSMLFYLVHNPGHIKDVPKGAVILYGHVHDAAPHGPHRINGHLAYHVGVDTNDYKPVSLDKIIDELIDFVMKEHDEL